MQIACYSVCIQIETTSNHVYIADFGLMSRVYHCRSIWWDRKNAKRGPLPSFLSNLSNGKRNGSKVAARVYTYDREIICFPKSFINRNGIVKIPRQSSTREFLVMNKLIGNIRLRSDMSEDEIMAEIRSVFSWPMKKDSLFRYKILQSSGGGCKSLSVRQVSSSYEWTASAVAGKNVGSPVYVIGFGKTRHNAAQIIFYFFSPAGSLPPIEQALQV